MLVVVIATDFSPGKRVFKRIPRVNASAPRSVAALNPRKRSVYKFLGFSPGGCEANGTTGGFLKKTARCLTPQKKTAEASSR